MHLNVLKDSIRIVPDNILNITEIDTAFIEHVLGLKNEGDSILLTRKNAYNLSCLAYLEAKKEVP